MSNLVVLSGGIDSTVCLASSLRSLDNTYAVSFDYGQRHLRELDAAADIAKHYDIPLEVIDLRGMLHGGALLDRSIPMPEGEYEEEGLVSTVVHGRNLLFVSVAVAALAERGDRVWVGVHSGDHALYPDCRPQFWQNLRSVVESGYGVFLHTPLLYKDKADIVEMGVRYGAPLNLTWSCYEGGERHCGKCGTCVERREAFQTAVLDDPTIYEV